MGGSSFGGNAHCGRELAADPTGLAVGVFALPEE